MAPTKKATMARKRSATRIPRKAVRSVTPEVVVDESPAVSEPELRKKELIETDQIVAGVNHPSFQGMGWSHLSTSQKSEGVVILLVAKQERMSGGEVVVK